MIGFIPAKDNIAIYFSIITKFSKIKLFIENNLHLKIFSWCQGSTWNIYIFLLSINYFSWLELIIAMYCNSNSFLDTLVKQCGVKLTIVKDILHNPKFAPPAKIIMKSRKLQKSEKLKNSKESILFVPFWFCSLGARKWCKSLDDELLIILFVFFVWFGNCALLKFSNTYIKKTFCLNLNQIMKLNFSINTSLKPSEHFILYAWNWLVF